MNRSTRKSIEAQENTLRYTGANTGVNKSIKRYTEGKKGGHNYTKSDMRALIDKNILIGVYIVALG